MEFINVVDVAEDSSIKIIEFDKSPANTFNLEFCEAIIETVRKFEKDTKIKGLIFKSSIGMFSAGIDLMEFIEPDSRRLPEFWTAFVTMFLTVYKSTLYTVAAIQGHCFAGGCIFSLACDYRIMVDGKSRIGLNEVGIGIPVPYWIAVIYAAVTGFRVAELSLQEGKLWKVEEALNIGLIDQISTEEDLIPKALEISKKYLKFHTEPLLGNLEENLPKDSEQLYTSTSTEETQFRLNKLLESLGIKPKL